jgi:DNA-binding transcriptional MocR family regulator
MNGSASRLAQELERLVSSVPAGTRLPATRELQRRHRVGPATVQAVVAKLARRGLVRTRPGAGTFTLSAPDQPVPGAFDHGWQTLALGPVVPGADAVVANLELPVPGTLSLATGYLDEGLQPTGLLAQAATRAARRPAAWSRPPLEGLDDLRQLFASELGHGIDRRQVLITPGGQAALSTCFGSLAQPGDTVLVESPTYQGALAAARVAGLVPRGVPTDSEGLRVELLADALQSSGARLIYAQPRWINPTGVRMSSARRSEILELIRTTGAFLIEDDAAADLELASSPFAPLVVDDPDGHVIYLRSLSKGVAPALRVAALVARGPAFTRLRAVQSVQGAFGSTLLQHIACDVLTAPGWPRHLRNVHRELAQRRDALVRAIRRHFPTWTIPHIPTCGLHLWVNLPDPDSEEGVLRAGAAAGVRLTAGGPYYPAEPVGAHLRFSYAANAPAAIASAIQRVAQQLGHET